MEMNDCAVMIFLHDNVQLKPVEPCEMVSLPNKSVQHQLHGHKAKYLIKDYDFHWLHIIT